jgi:Zn finger protein HypA/HybF involved in hydrogenase expression
MKISIPELRCLRCEHKWTPRKADVRQCPKCRSVLWNVPKEHPKKLE